MSPPAPTAVSVFKYSANVPLGMSLQGSTAAGGIRIAKISPVSLCGNTSLETGMILHSINGRQFQTDAEAVQFVKRTVGKVDIVAQWEHHAQDEEEEEDADAPTILMPDYDSPTVIQADLDHWNASFTRTEDESLERIQEANERWNSNHEPPSSPLPDYQPPGGGSSISTRASFRNSPETSSNTNDMLRKSSQDSNDSRSQTRRRSKANGGSASLSLENSAVPSITEPRLPGVPTTTHQTGSTHSRSSVVTARKSNAHSHNLDHTGVESNQSSFASTSVMNQPSERQHQSDGHSPNPSNTKTTTYNNSSLAMTKPVSRTVIPSQPTGGQFWDNDMIRLKGTGMNYDRNSNSKNVADNENNDNNNTNNLRDSTSTTTTTSTTQPPSGGGSTSMANIPNQPTGGQFWDNDMIRLKGTGMNYDPNEEKGAAPPPPVKRYTASAAPIRKMSQDHKQVSQQPVTEPAQLISSSSNPTPNPKNKTAGVAIAAAKSPPPPPPHANDEPESDTLLVAIEKPDKRTKVGLVLRGDHPYITIDKIRPNSLADATDLQVGMVIISINDKVFSGSPQAVEYLRTCEESVLIIETKSNKGTDSSTHKAAAAVASVSTPAVASPPASDVTRKEPSAQYQKGEEEVTVAPATPPPQQTPTVMGSTVDPSAHYSKGEKEVSVLPASPDKKEASEKPAQYSKGEKEITVEAASPPKTQNDDLATRVARLEKRAVEKRKLLQVEKQATTAMHERASASYPAPSNMSDDEAARMARFEERVRERARRKSSLQQRQQQTMEEQASASYPSPAAITDAEADRMARFENRVAARRKSVQQPMQSSPSPKNDNMDEAAGTKEDESYSIHMTSFREGTPIVVGKPAAAGNYKQPYNKGEVEISVLPSTDEEDLEVRPGNDNGAYNADPPLAHTTESELNSLPNEGMVVAGRPVDPYAAKTGMSSQPAVSAVSKVPSNERKMSTKGANGYAHESYNSEPTGQANQQQNQQNRRHSKVTENGKAGKELWREISNGRIGSQRDAPFMVEVGPGVTVPLRRTHETTDAISVDFFKATKCNGCSEDINCIADVQYVLCPECRVVSGVVGADFEGRRISPHGLGLGFTNATLESVQQEILMGRSAGSIPYRAVSGMADSSSMNNSQALIGMDLTLAADGEQKPESKPQPQQYREPQYQQEQTPQNRPGSDGRQRQQRNAPMDPSGISVMPPSQDVEASRRPAADSIVCARIYKESKQTKLGTAMAGIAPNIEFTKVTPDSLCGNTELEKGMELIDINGITFPNSVAAISFLQQISGEIIIRARRPSPHQKRAAALGANQRPGMMEVSDSVRQSTMFTAQRNYDNMQSARHQPPQHHHQQQRYSRRLNTTSTVVPVEQEISHETDWI